MRTERQALCTNHCGPCAAHGEMLTANHTICTACWMPLLVTCIDKMNNACCTPLSARNEPRACANYDSPHSAHEVLQGVLRILNPLCCALRSTYRSASCMRCAVYFVACPVFCVINDALLRTVPRCDLQTSSELAVNQTKLEHGPKRRETFWSLCISWLLWTWTKSNYSMVCGKDAVESVKSSAS